MKANPRPGAPKLLDYVGWTADDQQTVEVPAVQPRVDDLMTARMPISKRIGGAVRCQAIPLHPDDYTTLRTPAVRIASDRPVDFAPRMGKLLFIFVLCLTIDFLFIGASPHNWLNWYLTFVWCTYLPLTIIGFLGALAVRNQRIQPYVGVRQEQVIFLIPTVARKDTLPGLYRVIDSILLCAPRHLTNYTIHLLLEEDAEGSIEIQHHYRLHKHVICILIPKKYTPTRGTRYKARANQYAVEYRRQLGINGSDVFIYHGDDDTSIGHDTIWSIAQFIEKNDHDLAQGLLTFPHQLSKSWFCRLADSIRPGDDISRFYFCTGRIGTPLVGLHGEHLLIRANVEEELGWDFGPSVTVEDAYFGLHFASRYPGRATFLPSCSYGASPSSVSEFIRQRRRWAAGLVKLLADRSIPWKTKPFLCYSIANWTIGLFQHIILIVIIAGVTHSTDTSPVLSAIIAVWCANFAFQVWMYLEGLRVNLEASQAPRSRFLFLPFMIIPIIPFLSFVEALSAFLGLLDSMRKRQGFDVISKEL